MEQSWGPSKQLRKIRTFNYSPCRHYQLFHQLGEQVDFLGNWLWSTYTCFQKASKIFNSNRKLVIRLYLWWVHCLTVSSLSNLIHSKISAWTLSEKRCSSSKRLSSVNRLFLTLTSLLRTQLSGNIIQC